MKRKKMIKKIMYSTVKCCYILQPGLRRATLLVRNIGNSYRFKISRFTVWPIYRKFPDSPNFFIFLEFWAVLPLCTFTHLVLDNSKSIPTQKIFSKNFRFFFSFFVILEPQNRSFELGGERESLKNFLLISKGSIAVNEEK